MRIYSHVGCFLLWVILNYVPMTTYKAACRHLFSLLLVQTLGFQGDPVILLFWSASRLFHNHCTISHSCRQCVVALPFLHLVVLGNFCLLVESCSWVKSGISSWFCMGMPLVPFDLHFCDFLECHFVWAYWPVQDCMVLDNVYSTFRF